MRLPTNIHVHDISLYHATQCIQVRYATTVLSVSFYICLSVTLIKCVKTAEGIELGFGTRPLSILFRIVDTIMLFLVKLLEFSFFHFCYLI